MAMSVTISPGTLILLLCLRNILAQQCMGNIGQQNLAGAPQQLTKTTCGLNQLPQNLGVNYNTLPQQNMQQMNLQQFSNIQHPSTQQTGNLQQTNLQPASSQQSVNPITNSQIQQQNQNLVSNIFSALQNIRQVPQNTGANIVKPNPQQTNCCGLKQNIEQTSLPQSQNQALAYTVPILNNLQTANQSPPASTSFLEYPLYTFQAVPGTNLPPQQIKQIFPTDAFANKQNIDYPIQNQPTASQQPIAMQNPVVINPNTQIKTGQSQPIVFTLQPSQMQTSQSQPSLSTGQPIIYTVQTQPTSTNQNEINSNIQDSNNAGKDNQPLMAYLMSQMQNPQANGHPLAAILPAMLNTKSEKSSSMKALLPFILNMLTERRGGCVCPHCGCDSNHQNTAEPIINTGYSNQKNYSQQERTEDLLAKSIENNREIKSASKQPTIKVEEKKYEETENASTSEEDDEGEMSEEDYDEE